MGMLPPGKFHLKQGAGYVTIFARPPLGSEIAHYAIEHMLPPDRRTKAGGALYLDQFTEGFHVHHNVISDAIRWLFIWNPNIRGNRADTNFADTDAQRNDGTDNLVEPVNLARDGQWPKSAQAILTAAGLQPEFAHLRRRNPE